MPKPVYLPPTYDPTQMEMPTQKPGCLRFVAIITFIIGACMGGSLISFVSSAAASAAHPTPKAIATMEATRAGTPSVIDSARPPHAPTPAFPAAVAATAAATEPMCSHRVVWGETLLGISARYAASAWGIVNANKIKNSNRIYAGALLSWPCKAIAATGTPTAQPPTAGQAATMPATATPYRKHNN